MRRAAQTRRTLQRPDGALAGRAAVRLPFARAVARLLRMSTQIKVRYDPREDRLQLTVVVPQRVHHLLLTRRVWMSARLALQGLLELATPVPAGLPQAARQTVVAAHHQAVASQAKVQREPAGAADPSVQAELVVDLALGRRAAPAGSAGPVSWVLRFHLHPRRELSLVLDEQTLHALVHALLQKEEVAQWALPPLALRGAGLAPTASMLQ